MWDLERKEPETFSRNSLVTVVVQLRFEPILLLDRDDEAAGYQELIRERLPHYDRCSSQTFDLPLPSAAGSVPAVQVHSQPLHQFHSRDRKSTVGLTRESISLTEKEHVSRTETLGLVEYALDALASRHKNVHPTRLGIRYINQIDQKAVAAGLGRAVEWEELIRDQFLVVPLASGADRVFYSEVSSSCPVGAMTLRYGLIPDGGPDLKFRLDVDRFMMNPGPISDVSALLREFVSDIFSVFRAAAGDGLIEWMSGGDDDET